MRLLVTSVDIYLSSKTLPVFKVDLNYFLVLYIFFLLGLSFAENNDLQDSRGGGGGTILILLFESQPLKNIQRFTCNFAFKKTSSYFNCRSVIITGYNHLMELAFYWMITAFYLLILCQILLFCHRQAVGLNSYRLLPIHYLYRITKLLILRVLIIYLWNSV